MARHLASGPAPVGVGERAYPRFGPALFTPGYGILCGLGTADIWEMRAQTRVECLQERFPCEPPPVDTYSILSHPGLEAGPEPLKFGSRLLLYRQTGPIHEMALTRGWQLLANPPEIRLPWEHKAVFRKRLLAMGLPALQFAALDLESLTPEKCSSLMEQWGSPLVIQIPGFPQGGGRSSFMVREAPEILHLRRAWGQGVHRDHRFQEVMVSPWVQGPSLSMEGCVTPWGVLVSPLQLQLVDIPHVLPQGGFGRFCGHQWGARMPQEPWVEELARSITLEVGHAMAREGYRGIFGLDFALDQENQALWVLECNPRYTGAFPTLTLLQWANGLVPLEVFHVLSFLAHGPVKIPRELMEQTHQAIGPAAQLLLFHRDLTDAEVKMELPSGRYRWVEAEARGQRLGPALPFPASPVPPGEFLILDGPPPVGHRLRPGRELERVVRLVFFRDVLGQGPGGLAPDVVLVIQWVYRSLGLQ